MKNEIQNKDEAKKKVKKHLQHMALKKRPLVVETKSVKITSNNNG